MKESRGRLGWNWAVSWRTARPVQAGWISLWPIQPPSGLKERTGPERPAVGWSCRYNNYEPKNNKTKEKISVPPKHETNPPSEGIILYILTFKYSFPLQTLSLTPIFYYFNLFISTSNPYHRQQPCHVLIKKFHPNLLLIFLFKYFQTWFFLIIFIFVLLTYKWDSTYA